MARSNWKTIILALLTLQWVAGCHSQQPAGSNAPLKASNATSQAQPTQNGIQWITVRDTYENAFSIHVPKDWKVLGGLIRPTQGYPHPYIDMTSPDRKTNLRLGDVTIPSYTAPNRVLPILNVGQSVAPYVTGEQFATKYGLARLGALCQGIQSTRSGTQTPRYPVPASPFVHITGGDASFTCSLNGEPMAGYAYAETMLVSFGASGGNWYVVELASYLTPASEDTQTRTVLKQSADSIIFNPDWLAMQSKIIAAATQTNLQTAQGNMQAIKETNERMAQWSKNMQQQTDSFNDILNGVTLTQDPQSGAVREVPTGTGGQKWIDSQNNIGSGALSPGPDFHPLKTITRYTAPQN